MSEILAHFTDIVIVAVILIVCMLLFSKKMRSSSVWSATVTPLASIIGSGFLVIAPLFESHFGRYAPIAILLLLGFAYLIGAVIRENILAEKTFPAIGSLDRFSHAALLIAYVVSVAFYIKLLSSFLVHGMGIPEIGDGVTERLISSAILIGIALRSFLKGFKALERLEEYAVNGKLGVIAGLLIGLCFYNFEQIQAGTWTAGRDISFSWTGLRVLMGSLIVVQGFETSRFLTEHYSAKDRVTTMRYAQYISSGIYFVFISLMLVLSQSASDISDTAIIDLSAKVSRILPLFLVFAAVLSQLSAATADTIGSGGLLGEFFKKFPKKVIYLPTLFFATLLVWFTDVFGIIAIASRCFAAYYAIETVSSGRRFWAQSRPFAASLRYILAVVLLLCAILGLSAEG